MTKNETKELLQNYVTKGHLRDHEEKFYTERERVRDRLDALERQIRELLARGYSCTHE